MTEKQLKMIHIFPKYKASPPKKLRKQERCICVRDNENGFFQRLYRISNHFKIMSLAFIPLSFILSMETSMASILPPSFVKQCLTYTIYGVSFANKNTGSINIKFKIVGGHDDFKYDFLPLFGMVQNMSWKSSFLHACVWKPPSWPCSTMTRKRVSLRFIQSTSLSNGQSQSYRRQRTHKLAEICNF